MGGVDYGAPPVFEALGVTLHDCTFERLSNPGQTRVFRWVEGPGPDEESTVSPYWVSGQVSLLATKMTSIGAPRIVLMEYGASSRTIYFTDLEGWAFDAFRGGADCSQYGDVGPSRYGIVAPQDPANGKQLGGLLFDYDVPQPTVFLHPVGPPGIGPTPTLMGDARWLFRYFAPQLWSVDLASGMSLMQVSTYVDGETIEQGDATTSGGEFVFARLTVDPGSGDATGALMITDGSVAAEPYLIPPPNTEFLMRPAFAHTHLGWLRGINPVSVNKFEKLELWATAWTPEPGSVVPYFVADVPGTSTSEASGGEGWYQALLQPSASTLWHLGTESRVDLVAEAGVEFGKPLGVTGGRAYFAMRPASKNELKYLLRHALPSL